MSGERIHAQGQEGARRAKIWLEATTRVWVHWVNPVGWRKLTFEWADGTPFSFDLGGKLRGEDLDDMEFFGESKLYRSPADQGTLYREYLAKCYRSYVVMPNRCDAFMWITWAPFLVNQWHSLKSAATVRNSTLAHGARVFGEAMGPDYEQAVEMEVCNEVANRLWMIVLSEEQERLVLTREHRGIVERYIVDGH